MLIPLKHLSYSATIAGMFAQVTCEQEYKNEGRKPIEAVYVFPIPENASVIGCTVMIGQRRIDAELKEKVEAKAEYDAAIKEGHHASLLEQKRDNIFKMSVSGIEPGEDIRVIIEYNQRVHWQDSGGRFSIPLVVAPRFIPGEPIGRTGEGWSADTTDVPDASEITPTVLSSVSYKADIKVSLDPGFEASVSSPSHGKAIGISAYRDEAIDIIMQGLYPDRDFILCYRTVSNQVGTSLHHCSFNEDEFLFINAIPPYLASTASKDVIFCLDISGSMKGDKLDGLKIVTKKVIKLLEGDKDNRIGVVAFNHEVHPLLPLSRIDEKTTDAIDSLVIIGGTMAGQALDYCFKLLDMDTDRDRYILLVSDGESEDRWSNVVDGVKVVALGIDTAVNMAYLSDIADETEGITHSVYPGEDYDEVAAMLTGFLSGPVMSKLEVLSDGVPLDNVLGVKSVHTGMPASLSIRSQSFSNDLVLKGIDSDGNEQHIPLVMGDAIECSFIHQVWAREMLKSPNLSDATIIELGLRYHILSRLTSFIAVSEKAKPGEQPVKVEVSVSLPHGWDYGSIFGQPDILSTIKAFTSSSSTTTSFSTSSMHSLGMSQSQSSASSNSRIVRINDLVEILIVEHRAGILTEAAMDIQWTAIATLLTDKNLDLESDRGRAQLLYGLLKLQALGFKVSDRLIDRLMVAPTNDDTEAWAWWEKVQKHIDIIANMVQR
jgi:Ca-activated chloride channel family protein